jgi:hypothetical protein
VPRVVLFVLTVDGLVGVDGRAVLDLISFVNATANELGSELALTGMGQMSTLRPGS